jgi:hypothetical protein
MSDTYGGGLDLQSGAPQIDNSGSLPDAPQTPAPAPDPSLAAAPQPQAGSSSFGSSLRNLLPGANYTPPDPQTSALDQSADLLQQRIDRAGKIATNPLARIFAPESVQAARAAVPQMTEQLQTIKQQQQQQVDIQKSATNFGVPKSAQNPLMTNDTIDNYLLDQYKDGDFSKAKLLQARGKGDWVQDFAGQAVDGAGARLAAANTAITKLTAAGDSQSAYASALRSLTPEDKQAITSIGLQTIPDKASDWQGLVQQHGAAFAQAQQTYSQTKQRLNNITNFDGVVPKDVETASQEDIRIGSTNEPAGLPVRTRSIDGQVGHVGPNGAVQMEKYGLAPKDGGWSVTTADRLKKSDDMFATEDTKGAVNQYNIANKFKNEALNEGTYNSSAGLALLKDTLGGVGRDVAEKSAAAGTTGLSQMFSKQQGGFEGFLNTATNEIAAYKNWVDGGRKGDAPRISDETKRGVQFIANENYKFASDQAAGRLSGAMRYAGQIGRPLEDIPLDGALKNSVAQYHEDGRVDAINGWRSYPSVVRGNQRIFFPQGSNVNGANPPRPPLQSGLTPVQQAGQSPGVNPPQQPAPPYNTPGGGAGQSSAGPQGPAPQPVTVAGQQVNVSLPPGASPAYVASLQRIETGNEQSPWTATTASTSASGGFQFIDGSRTGKPATWEENKPPGAPARAADATPQQQADALSNLTQKNASALQTAGVPVNDTSLYVAHNLGAAGGAALLKANPNADARTVVGEAAAKNNPLFFKGRPNVATVIGRYQANVAQDVSDSVPRRAAPTPGAGQAPQGNPMDDPAQIAWNQLTPEQQAQGRQGGTSMIAGVLPAAASTVGGVIGSAGGPPGAIAGGAIGGYAGNAAKNYLRGQPQNQTENLEQAALGGVLGVASEAPLLTKMGLAAAGTRVAGSAAIEAGTTAAQGGNTADVVDAGIRGGAGALGGEALGRFVSSAGATAYKALSRYTTDAQSELSAQAGKLASARQVLKTEQPKLATGDANPKYDAAQQKADDAIAAIKDHGQNPDDMVHAYEQATSGVSAGEAAAMRKAQSEKTATSQGYNQLRSDVQDAAGKQVPKANQPLPHGPVAQIRTADNPTGAVEAKFAPDAEHAEMLIKAPAPNWGAKWQQLQDAGSELIQKRMSFLQNGDKPSADAMDSIFQGVRNQQKNAANYVFGPDKGKQVIGQLEDLDQRYAKVMNATQGMNYGKMRSVIQAGNTPESRALQKNFTAFAGDDPSAMRAFNAMKAGAKGRLTDEAKLMVPLITAESLSHLGGIPTFGAISALVGGHRLYKVMQEYSNAKVLGKAVTFKDFLNQEIQSSGVGQAVRGAVQRGAVQVGASP